MSTQAAGPLKLLKLNDLTTLYAVKRPLAFSGHYELTVLQGTVEISGVALSASTRAITVHNPTAPYHKLEPHFSLTDQNFLPLEAQNQFEDSATVVQITALPDPLAPWIDLCPPFKSLECPRLSRLPDHRLGEDTVQIMTAWRDLASQIRNGSTVITFGPKSSGKSTLSKTIANRMIVQQQTVYYLELDSGQPEYAPPGTMSLHLLGPDLNFSQPWLHPMMPNLIHATSFGFVSPIDTPQRYLEIAQHLYNVYQNHSQQTGPSVLIVNTPGWTKGLGLDLNASVCAIVRPTNLCYLGQDESYNELRDKIFKASDYTLTLESIAEFKPPGLEPPKFSAAELRMLKTMAYFYLSNPQHLTDWQPYELEWKKDAISGTKISGFGIIDSEGTDPEDIGIAIEGTLVALVAAPPNTECEYLEYPDCPVLTAFATLDLHLVGQCLGYAVVQHFDLARGICRLITSADPAIFERQKLFVIRGRQALPPYAYVNPRDSPKNTHIPWVSVQLHGAGSVYSRFRRNIQRK